jgi:desulfoferrodoxin (superoxide reductase-like protein)
LAKLEEQLEPISQSPAKTTLQKAARVTAAQTGRVAKDLLGNFTVPSKALQQKRHKQIQFQEPPSKDKGEGGRGKRQQKGGKSKEEGSDSDQSSGSGSDSECSAVDDFDVWTAALFSKCGHAEYMAVLDILGPASTMILKCPDSGKVEARLAAVSAVLQAAAAGVGKAAQDIVPAASGSGAATQMFYSLQAGSVIGVSSLAAPRQTQVKIKVDRGDAPMDKASAQHHAVWMDLETKPEAVEFVRQTFNLVEKPEEIERALHRDLPDALQRVVLSEPPHKGELGDADSCGMRMSTIMDVRLMSMKEALTAQCNVHGVKFPNPEKMAKLLATGDLRKISWPNYWSASSKSMWGSAEGASRAVPHKEREAWLQSVWPAMGRAYIIAHPWDSPYDWTKILDFACRCLRNFDTTGGARVAMTDVLWTAAWAAASRVMEMAFENVSEQHDMFRAGRGPRPTLVAVVGDRGPLAHEAAQACTAAVTSLCHIKAASERDGPNTERKKRRNSPPPDRNNKRGKEGTGGKKEEGNTKKIGGLLSEWKEEYCKGVSDKAKQPCIWNCLGRCKKGKDCDHSHKSPPGFNKAEWMEKAK